MVNETYKKLYAAVFSKGMQISLGIEKLEKELQEEFQSLKGEYDENSLSGAFLKGFERGIEEGKEIDKILEGKIADLKRFSNKNKELGNDLER